MYVTLLKWKVMINDITAEQIHIILEDAMLQFIHKNTIIK